jgi:hypothetical protein
LKQLSTSKEKKANKVYATDRFRHKNTAQKNSFFGAEITLLREFKSLFRTFSNSRGLGRYFSAREKFILRNERYLRMVLFLFIWKTILDTRNSPEKGNKKKNSLKKKSSEHTFQFFFYFFFFHFFETFHFFSLSTKKC